MLGCGYIGFGRVPVSFRTSQKHSAVVPAVDRGHAAQSAGRMTTGHSTVSHDPTECGGPDRTRWPGQTAGAEAGLGRLPARLEIHAPHLCRQKIFTGTTGRENSRMKLPAARDRGRSQNGNVQSEPKTPLESIGATERSRYPNDWKSFTSKKP